MTSGGIELRADPAVASVLPALAAGRTLVIDHFASRRCGATVGDLRARWAATPDGATVPIQPIDGVEISIEPVLAEVLESGATLVHRRWRAAGSLEVELDHPERWLEFLEAHPARRR
jgi:hypothetical protein